MRFWSKRKQNVWKICNHCPNVRVYKSLRAAGRTTWPSQGLLTCVPPQDPPPGGAPGPCRAWDLGTAFRAEVPGSGQPPKANGTSVPISLSTCQTTPWRGHASLPQRFWSLVNLKKLKKKKCPFPSCYPQSFPLPPAMISSDYRFFTNSQSSSSTAGLGSLQKSWNKKLLHNSGENMKRTNTEVNKQK